MTIIKGDVKIIEATVKKRREKLNKISHRKKMEILEKAAHDCWWMKAYLNQSMYYQH